MGWVIMPIEQKFTLTHLNVLVSNETSEPPLSNVYNGSAYISIDQGSFEF